MSFGFDLLFEICVPRPWADGKERARFHQALEQAAFAEECGFDTIWLVEHHFLTELAHSSAPEVFLGALSQRTSKIRLGHGVALLPGRVNHPIRVAERAALIDILSDGRLEMGTGRSSSPYQLRAFGVDVANTREEWEEAAKLLPRLWTEEKVSHRGRSFEWSDEVTVVPKPVQRPHPPLWVAATQPDTCELAGQKGMGLLMSSIKDPEMLRPQIEAYKAAIASPNDQIGAFVNDQCALFTVAFCADDDDRARVIGGEGGLWYLRTVADIYKNDWAGQPLESVPDSYRYHAEIRRKRGAGGNWGSGLSYDPDRDDAYQQMIDSGAMCVGSPAEVLAKVRKYRDIGGDRLVSVMQLADIEHEDLMRSIELFGREVIAKIRAEEAATSAAPATSR